MPKLTAPFTLAACMGRILQGTHMLMNSPAEHLSPRVSFIIPTLNSAHTLGACLSVIRGQNFPREQIEIIIADAGSSDATLAIAHQHAVDQVVSNPLTTGEAGKSAGIRAANGTFLAFVDSDNVLDSPDWLRLMLAPFDDPGIVATEPLWYTRRPTDPAMTRYFAMLGMNDPICLFLGSKHAAPAYYYNAPLHWMKAFTFLPRSWNQRDGVIHGSHYKPIRSRRNPRRLGGAPTCSAVRSGRRRDPNRMRII